MMARGTKTNKPPSGRSLRPGDYPLRLGWLTALTAFSAILLLTMMVASAAAGNLGALSSRLALYAAGDPVTPEEEAASKALTESKCGTCHSMTVTTATKRSEAGWRTVMDNMAAKGTSMTPAQYDSILGYLVRNFGTGSTTDTTPTDAALTQTKCSSCHSYAKSTEEGHDRAGWSKVIDEMVAAGMVVTTTEREKILGYLTTDFGPGAGNHDEDEDEDEDDDVDEDDDNDRPHTYAPRKASVKKGKTARLYYKISDKSSSKVHTTIKVKTSSGKTKKTIDAGWAKPGKQRYVRYTAKLKKGTYRFYVYAKDKAGNRQANVARSTLRVR